MSFRIDRTAPRLPEFMERLASWNVKAILDGSIEICSTIENNDSDIWHLTKAGQFVRQTGIDADRFYVWPIGEAFEYLDGMVEERQWARVTTLLQEAGIELPNSAVTSGPRT